MKDSKVLALVKKAKNHNQKAFAKLCELKVNEIIFLCVREMGNLQDGQDAAQEVFIQMQKSLPALQAPEAFNVWLNRLIHHTCLNMKRKTMRHNEMLNTESFEDFLMDETLVALPQEYLEEAEKKQNIVAMIDGLPGKYRSCVILHYYQNLSYAEIAEVLDITVDAVNNNMRMARKYMKRQLVDKNSGGVLGAGAFAAIGPLVSKGLAEAAHTTISAATAQQCLAAAGITTSVAAGAGLVGSGVAAKAAMAALAVSIAAGTGVYTVATYNGDTSPPASVPAQAPIAAPEEISEADHAPAAARVATGNTISGRVYLKAGDTEAPNGLEGAVLELVDAGDPATVLYTATSAGGGDGGFTLGDIAPGEYMLRITLPANGTVTAQSPTGVGTLQTAGGLWVETEDGNCFLFEENDTVFDGLEIEAEVPTLLTGHIELYYGGAAIGYDESLLPGIAMELYDPQGNFLAQAPITTGGEYTFEEPMIAQRGLYTLHVKAEENAGVALVIPDEEIQLEPGYSS